MASIPTSSSTASPMQTLLKSRVVEFCSPQPGLASPPPGNMRRSAPSPRVKETQKRAINTTSATIGNHQRGRIDYVDGSAVLEDKNELQTHNDGFHEQEQKQQQPQWQQVLTGNSNNINGSFPMPTSDATKTTPFSPVSYHHAPVVTTYPSLQHFHAHKSAHNSSNTTTTTTSTAAAVDIHNIRTNQRTGIATNLLTLSTPFPFPLPVPDSVPDPVPAPVVPTGHVSGLRSAAAKNSVRGRSNVAAVSTEIGARTEQHPQELQVRGNARHSSSSSSSSGSEVSSQCQPQSTAVVSSSNRPAGTQRITGITATAGPTPSAGMGTEMRPGATVGTAGVVTRAGIKGKEKEIGDTGEHEAHVIPTVDVGPDIYNLNGYYANSSSSSSSSNSSRSVSVSRHGGLYLSDSEPPTAPTTACNNRGSGHPYSISQQLHSPYHIRRAPSPVLSVAGGSALDQLASMYAATLLTPDRGGGLSMSMGMDRSYYSHNSNSNNSSNNNSPSQGSSPSYGQSQGLGQGQIYSPMKHGESLHLHAAAYSSGYLPGFGSPGITVPGMTVSASASVGITTDTVSPPKRPPNFIGYNTLKYGQAMHSLDIEDNSNMGSSSITGTGVVNNSEYHLSMSAMTDNRGTGHGAGHGIGIKTLGGTMWSRSTIPGNLGPQQQQQDKQMLSPRAVPTSVPAAAAAAATIHYIFDQTNNSNNATVTQQWNSVVPARPDIFKGSPQDLLVALCRIYKRNREKCSKSNYSSNNNDNNSDNSNSTGGISNSSTAPVSQMTPTTAVDIAVNTTSAAAAAGGGSSMADVGVVGNTESPMRAFIRDELRHVKSIYYYNLAAIGHSTRTGTDTGTTIADADAGSGADADVGAAADGEERQDLESDKNNNSSNMKFGFDDAEGHYLAVGEQDQDYSNRCGGTSTVTGGSYGNNSCGGGGWTRADQTHIDYRYQVCRYIGSGAFSRIYRCLDHKRAVVASGGRVMDSDSGVVAMKINRNIAGIHKQAAQECDILYYIQQQLWQRRRRRQQNNSNNSTGTSDSICQLLNSFVFRSHYCLVFPLYGLNLADYMRLLNTLYIRAVQRRLQEQESILAQHAALSGYKQEQAQGQKIAVLKNKQKLVSPDIFVGTNGINSVSDDMESGSSSGSDNNNNNNNNSNNHRTSPTRMLTVPQRSQLEEDQLQQHNVELVGMKQIKSIAKQILGALTVLKTLHVIHADIKPQNICIKNPGFIQRVVDDFVLPVSSGNAGTPSFGKAHFTHTLLDIEVVLIDFSCSCFEATKESAVGMCEDAEMQKHSTKTNKIQPDGGDNSNSEKPSRSTRATTDAPKASIPQNSLSTVAANADTDNAEISDTVAVAVSDTVTCVDSNNDRGGGSDFEGFELELTCGSDAPVVDSESGIMFFDHQHHLHDQHQHDLCRQGEPVQQAAAVKIATKATKVAENTTTVSALSSSTPVATATTVAANSDDGVSSNDDGNNNDAGSYRQPPQQHMNKYIQSRFYRAPEVLLEHPYDCSIDIFGLAIVLMELFLCGNSVRTTNNNKDNINSNFAAGAGVHNYSMFQGESEEAQMHLYASVLDQPCNRHYKHRYHTVHNSTSGSYGTPGVPGRGDGCEEEEEEEDDEDKDSYLYSDAYVQLIQQGQTMMQGQNQGSIMRAELMNTTFNNNDNSGSSYSSSGENMPAGLRFSGSFGLNRPLDSIAALQQQQEHKQQQPETETETEATSASLLQQEQELRELQPELLPAAAITTTTPSLHEVRGPRTSIPPAMLESCSVVKRSLWFNGYGYLATGAVREVVRDNTAAVAAVAADTRVPRWRAASSTPPPTFQTLAALVSIKKRDVTVWRYQQTQVQVQVQVQVPHRQLLHDDDGSSSVTATASGLQLVAAAVGGCDGSIHPVPCVPLGSPFSTNAALSPYAGNTIPSPEMADNPPKYHRYQHPLSNPNPNPNPSPPSLETCQFVSFLELMFTWSPTIRITPARAIKHPWLLPSTLKSTA